MTVVVGRRWTTWKKDNYRLYVWIPESKQYTHVYTWGYDGFDNNGGDTWTKYINIPITTAPSEYAQYKVVIDASNVTVYSADGTQKAQGAVASDIWANVKSDGSDIRVFDQAKSQLYFWVEEFDYSNKKAVIWVNLTAGSSELNIAYDNPSATKSDYEDGEQVFEFFDDFEGTVLDTTKWEGDVSNFTVENGYLKLFNSIYFINTKATFSEGVIIHTKAKIVTPADVSIAIIGLWLDSSDHVQYCAIYSNIDDRILKDASWEVTGLSISALDTWYTYSVKPTSNGTEFYRDGNLMATSAKIVSGHHIALGSRADLAGSQGGSCEVWWDYVLVTKPTDPADFGTPTVRTF